MRLKMAPGDSPPALSRMSATLCGSLSAAVNACHPSTPACVRRRLTSSAVTAGGRLLLRRRSVWRWRRVRDVGATLCLVHAGCPVLWLRGGAVLRGRAHAAGTAMRRVRDVGAALCLVRAGRPVLWLRGGAVLRGRAHAAGTAMRRPPAVSGVRRVRDVGAPTSGRWAWFGACLAGGQQGLAGEVEIVWPRLRCAFIALYSAGVT